MLDATMVSGGATDDRRRQ